jgi:hypothetical protein
LKFPMSSFFLVLSNYFDNTNYARNRIMHGLESSGSQSRAKSMIFGHENGC